MSEMTGIGAATIRAVDLWDDLQWRGLAYQWTGEDALPARLRRGPLTVYCGFDPTASSLHIGNLVGLTALRRFQKAGHRPIAIAGGATGMIGDPGGRSEERNLLSADELGANLVAIKAQIERFIDLDAGGLLLNNAEWFEQMPFIAFLRDVGKHVPVNVMLARESVSARMQSAAGISYTEFSYQLMQAYDFVKLYDAYECELQLGGSDQYGNIVAGVELGRRMRGVQLFGSTWPLVTRSDGAKMGKTAEGAVWLDPARTSPYAFYQWFLRVPDADAGKFLRVFTELDHDEIVSLEKQAVDAPAQREAQRALARALTSLVHGPRGLAAAERATSALFGGDLSGLSEKELLEIFSDVPSGEVPVARLGGLGVQEAFVLAGLARSNSEARKLIEAGGATIGNRKLVDAGSVLSAGDLTAGSVMVLRAGKRNFGLVRFRD